MAHRLSSIRAADRVVFVEEGRIVELGTLAELTAAGGRFADFAAQQHAASAWRVAREPQDDLESADAPPSTAL